MIRLHTHSCSDFPRHITLLITSAACGVSLICLLCAGNWSIVSRLVGCYEFIDCLPKFWSISKSYWLPYSSISSTSHYPFPEDEPRLKFARLKKTLLILIPLVFPHWLVRQSICLLCSVCTFCFFKLTILFLHVCNEIRAKFLTINRPWIYGKW